MAARWMKWSGRTVACVAGLLLVGELAARLLGLTDFPVYQVDDRIGYLPAPDQQGAFLRTHDWAYNNRSMGVAAPWPGPSGRQNLLLIGNSIVSGGNPYRQADKLGPQLQSNLGAQVAVWPMAAGGWSAVNETVNLERNPDVVASTDVFVWQLMAGTFSQVSGWRGDLIWPRERPVLATVYLARRYLLPRWGFSPGNDLPPAGVPVQQNVERFEKMVAALTQAAARGTVAPAVDRALRSADVKTRGFFVLYPTQDDMQTRREHWLAERADLERIAARHGVRVIDVSKIPGWGPEMYRDGVHPTPAGNELLARHLAQQVQASLM